MAMLAEPRRRQKLSFDPRNKAWSDDSSKFGQKLMEKMGWSQGKGLGAHEDGSLSHVKVTLKNNNLGVGCTASQEDNWIAHQDDFNDLLSTLNQDHAHSASAERESQSLEERSKKSKRRVHYKKFTRGKDLTKYGKEGMNSILGRRLTQSAPVTPQSQSVENSDEEPQETEGEEQDKSHGVVTIKGSCSVGEYFAQKMSALRQARFRVESESHSDTELEVPRCGFGFTPAVEVTGQRSDFASGSREDSAGSSGAGGHGSKTGGGLTSEVVQRMGFVSAGVAGAEDRKDEGLVGNEGEEDQEMESEEGHHERSGKKKKKRKKKRARNVERDSDEGNDVVVEVRAQSDNEEDEGIDVGRKKKKNKKKKRLVDEVTMESRSESASEQNGMESGEKKKKKKTKKSKKDKNRNKDVTEHSCSVEEEDMGECSEERSGGEASRKRKRDSNEEGLEDDGEETSSFRKKSRKGRTERGDGAEGGESSTARRKKKKKQKM